MYAYILPSIIYLYLSSINYLYIIYYLPNIHLSIIYHLSVCLYISISHVENVGKINWIFHFSIAAGLKDRITFSRNFQFDGWIWFCILCRSMQCFTFWIAISIMYHKDGFLMDDYYHPYKQNLSCFYTKNSSIIWWKGLFFFFSVYFFLVVTRLSLTEGTHQ